MIRDFETFEVEIDFSDKRAVFGPVVAIKCCAYFNNPIIMSISAKLILTGQSIKKDIFVTRADLGNKYDSAEVDATTERKSLWVIYSTKSWDHEHPASHPGVVKVLTAEEGLVNLSPFIGSAQGFDMTDPCIILFEHSEFRGYGQKFEYSKRDITESFPAGQVSGASSFIIIGGKWKLNTGTGGTGSDIFLNGKTVFGPGRYDLAGVAVNDQVKSIVRVQVSQ